MPQGTFVPSHCSSFSPQTKGIILYLNTFHTTIGCFLQTYFHSKVNNRFIVCALSHRFTLLSCAKTVCSDSFSFTENVLISKPSPCVDIFDPVSVVEEYKAAEIEKEKLTRHLTRLESFQSTMERKAQASRPRA